MPRQDRSSPQKAGEPGEPQPPAKDWAAPSSLLKQGRQRSLLPAAVPGPLLQQLPGPIAPPEDQGGALPQLKNLPHILYQMAGYIMPAAHVAIFRRFLGAFFAGQGHLVRNLQPEGGLEGEGRSPVRMMRSLFRVGSGTGIADIRAFVYG